MGESSTRTVTSTWLPVAGITGWQTTASICFYAIFAGTSLFRDAYDLSSAFTGLLLTTLMLGYTLFLFPMGTIIDAYGERISMVFGLAGLGTVSLAIAFVETLPTFLVAVFLLGSCYATAIPSTNRAVLHAVPAERTNLAMGIKQVGVTAGSAISAALVMSLAAAYAWDSGFIVTGALALTILSGFAVWYEDREGMGASIAFAGLLLLSGVQIAGSVSRIASGHILDQSSRPTSVTGPLVLTVYALAAAVAPVALTRVRTVAAAALTFCVLGYALLGFMGVYYSYLAVIVPEEKLGEATAGAQVAVNSGAIIAPPLFGSLVDAVSFEAA